MTGWSVAQQCVITALQVNGKIEWGIMYGVKIRPHAELKLFVDCQLLASKRKLSVPNWAKIHSRETSVQMGQLTNIIDFFLRHA